MGRPVRSASFAYQGHFCLRRSSGFPGINGQIDVAARSALGPPPIDPKEYGQPDSVYAGVKSVARIVHFRCLSYVHGRLRSDETSQRKQYPPMPWGRSSRAHLRLFSFTAEPSDALFGVQCTHSIDRLEVITGRKQEIPESRGKRTRRNYASARSQVWQILCVRKRLRVRVHQSAIDECRTYQMPAQLMGRSSTGVITDGNSRVQEVRAYCGVSIGQQPVAQAGGDLRVHQWLPNSDTREDGASMRGSLPR